jgi:hypothetical protein
MGITCHGKQVSTPERGRQRHIGSPSDPPHPSQEDADDEQHRGRRRPAQIRFLEQRLSTDANKVEAVRVERVTDDMLAGYEGKLYHVSMKHKVDLSPELRGRTGIGQQTTIVKGSAAINALVKFAATLIPGTEKTLKREIVNRIGEDITKKGVPDIRAAIRKAVSMLSSDLQSNEKWKELADVMAHVRYECRSPAELTLQKVGPLLLPHALRRSGGEEDGNQTITTSRLQKHFIRPNKGVRHDRASRAVTAGSYDGVHLRVSDRSDLELNLSS